MLSEIRCENSNIHTHTHTQSENNVSTSTKIIKFGHATRKLSQT